MRLSKIETTANIATITGARRRQFILHAPLLLFVAGSLTEGMAADLRRQVDVEPQHRNDAVMITKITVGDLDVQCGLLIGPRDVQSNAQFQAGDDWLQNMTVYLFNRTERTIVAGKIRLGFPELGDGRTQPRPQYVISLGKTPSVVAFDGRSGKPLSQEGKKLLTFAPGQTLAIHIADYIDGIRQTIESRTSFSMISKVSIYNGPYYFEDGMMWGGGCFNRQVPDRPGVFRCIPDADYFPGNMYKYWPPPR
jgi:hypothetical protein